MKFTYYEVTGLPETDEYNFLFSSPCTWWGTY